MIVDEVKIYLKAGNGGEGCFSSMKLSPRRTIGGGGDGGRGGDVILKVSPHGYDLYKFREKRKFSAQDGKRGGPYNKKGKNGNFVIVNVPEGTIVKEQNGIRIVDMAGEIKEFLICRGGHEGRGNYKRNCTFPAGQGEAKEVTLDYRVPNDIVVIGFPNTGKTSLVNILTGKDFKTASYPFTTAYCSWAVGEYGFKRFTVMDTPPLKKDGLKTRAVNFLKQLYRTKIIILVSDSLSECSNDFSLLKRQIYLFDKSLAAKKIFFYLLNKIDKIDKIESPKGVIPVSIEKGIGIEGLKKRLVSKLK